MSEAKKQAYVGNMSIRRGQGPKDANVRAWEIVQQATGEMPKELPEEPSERAKIGRMGGLKGGAARKAALTPEQRSEIAKKAAAKRWTKS